jgi:pimeloyl-ACP methyl ester carboxylesterase
MPQVEINGVSIFYEDAGEGDPVLFIHGFGSDLLSWGLVLRELRKSFRGIVYDQRDSGRSSRARGQYSIRDLADDAAGLIRAVGIGPCHVVGFSMGGAVTQELAINHPDAVRSITLVATYTKGDARGSDNLRSWAKLREQFDPVSYFRAIYPWLLTHREYEWPGFVEENIRRAVEAPYPQEQDAYLRQMEATLAHDAEDRLTAIQAPALVLVGEDDILAPLRFSRTLAASIPDARLMVLPEVGHALLWVKPYDVSRAIQGFLQSLEDRQSG